MSNNLLLKEDDTPLAPNQTRTYVVDTVLIDEQLQKPYLLKSDVKRVYYYQSESNSTFKIDVDDDALDGKIYLNVISSIAQRQFEYNKEGVVCINTNGNQINKQDDNEFVLRNSLLPNEEILIKKDDKSKQWQRAKIIEFRKHKREVFVELLSSSFINQTNKNDNKINKTLEPNKIVVPFHCVAYLISPKVNLTKAYRIVGKVYSSNQDSKVSFLSGKIIDLAKKANRFRYLIYFENGLTSYVCTKDISIIFDQSVNYERFTKLQKDFMDYYFRKYPEIETPRYKNGDEHMICIKVPNRADEVYAKVRAKVIRTDCKLVLFNVPKYNSSVWLYRGDFMRISNIMPDNSSFSENIEQQQSKINEKQQQTEDQQQQSPYKNRPVRKKGLARPQNRYNVEIEMEELDFEDSDKENDKNLEGSDDDEEEGDGLEEEQTIEEQVLLNKKRELTGTKPDSPPVLKQVDIFNKESLCEIVDHQCTNSCLNKYDQENFNTYGYSIFLRPLIYGWKRLIDYRYDYTRYITYLSPCGIRYYDIESIFDYLQLTESNLAIDNFSLDPDLIVGENFDLKCYLYVRDISQGTEKNQPVSLANTVDSCFMDGFEYIAERILSEKVKNDSRIHMDDVEFQVCCDCTDNCRNPNTCACQRLTKENARVTCTGEPEYPLKNRLLYDKILTGIYECNTRCNCNLKKHLCINRNAQLGLRNKLQLFRTSNKGWGVRSLNDIPKGSFICSYTGVLVNNLDADTQGLKFGDTYLADLDLIETVEDTKYDQFNLDSFDFNLSEEERIEKKQIETEARTKAFRNLFGDFNLYVINGGMKGNVGRFINHSCEPNCFAQNVFVDNHDLRFPWLAFYSLKFIPAYTEITWDYHYQIDTVANKQIKCLCGADNCRKRLL